MQLGLLTAPFEDTPLIDVARWAAANGYSQLEVASWPSASGDRRRYAGTAHLPIEDMTTDRAQQITGELAEVGVSISGEGTGISCNFTGTRVSDGVPAMVEFTLLQRGEATLVFRDTIPTAVAVDSTAREQLVAMECEAATSFGVAVDQCALIPAPADG